MATTGNLIHTCNYRVWRHHWTWNPEATIHYHDNQPGSPLLNHHITHCPRCGQKLHAKDLKPPPAGDALPGMSLGCPLGTKHSWQKENERERVEGRREATEGAVRS